MKKALIVWGGWDGHDPEEGAHIIADMLRGDGFEVQIETQTKAFLDPALTSLA